VRPISEILRGIQVYVKPFEKYITYLLTLGALIGTYLFVAIFIACVVYFMRRDIKRSKVNTKQQERDTRIIMHSAAYQVHRDQEYKERKKR
jgi:hypothetical protein